MNNRYYQAQKNVC